MAFKKQKNAEKRGVYKELAFREFVRWSALPMTERMLMGITDQGEFAKAFGINKDTLTRWKQRPEFEPSVNELRMSWGRDKTPSVVGAIYKSAMQGNAASQKLWMECFYDVNSGVESPKEEKGQPKIILHPNDLRFIIDGFPDDAERTKYYGYLRDIIDAGVRLRNKGLLKVPGNNPYPRDDSFWDEAEDELAEEKDRKAEEKDRKLARRFFMSIHLYQRSERCDSFSPLSNQAMPNVMTLHVPVGTTQAFTTAVM